MPKIRHLAFVCKEPRKMGDFLHEAFGLEILYWHEGSGVTVLSDGDLNITLLHEGFAEHDPVAWHFGLEMTQEEIEAIRPHLEALGTPIREGVRDGRPVEAFLKTPEGHRIDLAPFWPTKRGQSRRQQEYLSLGEDAAPAAAGRGA
jgi:catechol 2,3-dioxygenase-like lactoylglutathione lyase family enzyme